MMINKRNKAFSLIELLIVMAIITILAALALFGTQGVRQQGRDGRRKADMEVIRSGLETYKSDCNVYPATLNFGGTLNGTGGTPVSCAAANQYIARVPADPQAPTRTYYYARGGTGNTYLICAQLEIAPNPAVDVTGCGSNCGGACNYKVISP